MDTREKTVAYRRAEWFNDGEEGDLEAVVRSACRALDNIDRRTIRRTDGRDFKIVDLVKARGGGLLMHVTAETKDDHASVIPHHQKHQQAVDVGITPPPAAHEFMDGDAFLYVTGNHVVYCATNITEGSIGYYLKALFERARLNDSESNFDLLKAADISKIRLIERRGVKEVRLRQTLFDATARYEGRKADPGGLFARIKRGYRALTESVSDDPNDAVRVTLSFGADSRRSNVAVGYEKLEAMAKAIIDEDEYCDYLIVTKDNQKIIPHEILINKRIHIKRHGKSVTRESAYRAIERFHGELSSAGALDQ